MNNNTNNIDVSTHQLAEDVYSALCQTHGSSKPMSKSVMNLSLDDVLNIWYAIGNVVKGQLIQRKGIKLSSFGTFTVSADSVPLFIIAGDLMMHFKLKQRAQITADNLPTNILNLAQVSSETSIPRERIEKVYAKFISVMGKYITEGRSISLSIHKVAEIRISNNELSTTFRTDFVNLIQNKISAAGGAGSHQPEAFRYFASQTSAAMKKDQEYMNSILLMDKDKPSSNQTSLQIGLKTDAKSTGKARPHSAGRGRVPDDRNPITGELNFDRRPNSASTGSDLRPTSSASSNASSQRNYLNQRPSSTSRPVGAREVAAKALDVGEKVIQRVREKIVERGGSNGIRSITKLLAIMDNNGDKRLSKEELKYGLRDYGIDLSPSELEQVFLYFDRDRNGFIDVTEFLVGIRGSMNSRRKRFVRMAFDILDTDKTGTITVEEIMKVYDFTWHPEVRTGKKTVKEAARDFMQQWDRKEKDGIVTVEEFEDYYNDISASIDDDTYFELMIRNAWRIAGGEGMAANTANRRVLVTNKDGSQSVQTINRELGMNAKDMNDVRGRLGEQGLSGDFNVELFGGSDSRDKARNPNARPSNRNLPRPPTPPKDIRNRRPASPPPLGRGGTPRDAQLQSNGPLTEFDVLRKTFYSPPVPIESLCSKLQVAMSSASPHIAKGAFMQRLHSLEPQLSKDVVKRVWDVIDPNNSGSVEIEAIHNMLASRYGKDKAASKNGGVIDKAIKKILERCGENGGIKSLQRTISIMDNNGDKRLCKDELKCGLADYGLELNAREIDDIFSYFDRDKSGFVDVTEFLVGIRGDLNPRRKKLVKMAFDILDTDKSGFVSVEEMMSKYDVSHNSEVQSGRKSAKQAMKEFMAQWDTDGDSTVSLEEFEDYYKAISASIDGDDYFELMIRNAWRIAGGEGMAANTANRRVLVTNKDGSQSVQTINRELGMNAKDMNDVHGRLGEQGLSGDFNVELFGGSDSRDKARNPNARPGASHGNRRPPTPPKGFSVRPTSSREALNNAGPKMFEKHAAAAKLAAAFRGRLGRKVAEQERRKQSAEWQRQQDEEVEINRPKARQINRPKGKSFSGF